MKAGGIRSDWWKRRKARQLAVRYVFAVMVTAVFLFPVYWMGITSLKRPDEIFGYPPVWYPAEVQFDNFRVIIQGGDAKAIVNSIVIASFSTFFVMVFGTMTAYSLARFKTGGNALAVGILSIRMIPPIALVFPLFLLYVHFGWVDTHGGLILVYTAMILPYVIWVMRGYMEEIPVEVEESAMIDGCSRWMVLWKVVFPMARNGILATGVFAFIMAMNEFVFALVLTRSKVITFPVQITHYFSAQATYWGKISAISVLGSLPVFITILAMQRYLVRSMSMGAVKG